MAAIGIRLSPAYEKTQKMRELQTAEKAARKSVEAVDLTSKPLNNEEFVEAIELGESGAKRFVDIKQQQFELDPTTERYQDLLRQKTELKAFGRSVQQVRESTERLRQAELATQRAEAELNARQTEVRGPQPTITQQLSEDDPVVRATRGKLVEPFRQRMRGETNGNNQ